MAKNKLTPKTDLATRSFFITVNNDESFLSESPASRRALISHLLEALNYTWLPNGSFVTRGINITMPYGSADYSNYPNEWEADKERAIANLNNKSTPETSASSKAESTEVRKAVLSEDV